jgi:outer membrane protein insertion porin family
MRWSTLKKLSLAILTCFLWALPLGAQEITVKRVAVFPFSILSKEPAPGIAEKIQQTIIGHLEKEGFGIVSAEDLQREIAASPSPSAAASIEIGKKLGADAILTGSLIKIGPTVSLEAQLTDLTGKVTPTPFKLEGTGLASVDQLTAKLAKDAGLKVLGQERIAKMEVKGNRRVEKEAILATVQTRPGELTSTVRLRDDLKALYNLGSFSDVKIDVTDSPQGRIVTFIVTEKPSISAIIVQATERSKPRKFWKPWKLSRIPLLPKPLSRNLLTRLKPSIGKKGIMK